MFITLMNMLANKTLARKRSKRILLFPIIVPLFLLGWVLTWVGTRKVTPAKPTKRPAKPAAKETLEIGVLPEIETELVAETPQEASNT